MLRTEWNAKVILVAGLVTMSAVACGGAMHPDKPVAETIDARGVTMPTVAAESSSTLEFVNRDEKLHQIYSNDCPELSSSILQPGQEFQARLGIGPKTCHFEDLLAPTTSGFWGTVRVKEATQTLDGLAGG